jgi:small-conductance mechanosensitive channel
MVSGFNPFGARKIHSRRYRISASSDSGRGRSLCALLLVLAMTAAISVSGRQAYSAQDQSSPVASPVRSTAPASSSPTSRVIATPAAVLGVAASLPQANAVITYLGEVVSWYHDRDKEASMASEPAEALIAADDRHIASDIVNLAFEAARAAVPISQNSAASSADHSETAGTGSRIRSKAPIGGVDDGESLAAKTSEFKAQLNKDKALVADLKARLQRASKQDSALLAQSLANAQAQLQLDQSRLDAVSSIAAFENSEHMTETGSPDTLAGQIDELQRSVAPALDQQQSSAVPTTGVTGYGGTQPGGLLSSVRSLIWLIRKDSTLQQAISQTTALRTAAAQYRAPLAEAAADIYDQALQLAKEASTGDYATVRKKSTEFQSLAALHKAIVPALLPLTKQDVLLNLYVSNLERWRALVGDRIKDEVRALVLSLSAFGVLLAIVAGGSIVWRRLTFRYVQDFQRRHILMQLRRVTVGIVVSLILIFGFASELGTLGTVLGFAAAGIALALQNVILSLAGYFYVSGRFGIRVADRIQLSGISGDVLEIGLFRLTLMELSNDDFGFQATGRVVVFPNSVVFQPNGNFFKQLPGTSFMWNELRLTLSPDCDYRLAEKKILEVVNGVFARYRDSIQRESRNVELDLNIRFEMPKPQTRIELRSTGLAMVIRYPVPLRDAVETADEIARRLVDALRREPGLELVSQGTESLRPTPVVPHPSAAPASDAPVPDAAASASEGAGKA